MTAPDDNVIAFPSPVRTDLSWYAQRLANAAQRAAEAIDQSHRLAERLRACAEQDRALALCAADGAAMDAVRQTAGLCRNLARQMAEA